MTVLTFDEVEVSEVLRAKRGRKPSDEILGMVDAIRERFTAEPTKALRITSFGNVGSQEKRQTIQQQIRTAAKLALPNVAWTIEWTPEGSTVGEGKAKKNVGNMPQLRINAKKTAELAEKAKVPATA